MNATDLDTTDFIIESKRLCGELEKILPLEHLPSQAAIFQNNEGELITAKIPSKLAGVVGSLSWRAHDFSSLACELFERDRVISGAVIARALMETTALIYLTHRKIKQTLSERNLSILDDYLITCMSGNRLSDSDPKSLHILTAIDKLDKEPGCDSYRRFYDSLCEFAHPNALGSFYAYTKFDNETRKIDFGLNRGLTKGDDVAFTVIFALEVLLEFVQRIDDMTPELITLSKDMYPN